MYRLFSLGIMVVALVLVAQTPGQEKDKDKKVDKNVHTGTFISAKGNEFTMKEKEKEHSHVLAADGKVTGPDGKDCKLEDLKAGQKIRVTTKEGDAKTALKVEAMKKKE